MVVQQYICSSTPRGAQLVGANAIRIGVAWWFGSTSAPPHLEMRKRLEPKQGSFPRASIDNHSFIKH